VKAVVGHVDLIHSVDRLSLLNTIGRFARDLGIEQDVLVEVNVAGESSKSGINPRAGKSLISEWENIDGIRLCGLMLMPPPAMDPEESRPHFAQARRWLEEWKPSRSRHPWNQLSMGTSQDFAVAIEEGATLLRVGTALFGPRV
jgi:pyridoxal phosphate enzyme (YggS family)